MTFELSRRNFGRLSLGAAVALSTGQVKADSGYANPEILMQPEDLLSRVAVDQLSKPAYERDGVILIDVRMRAEYESGHIPGARFLEPNAVVAEHSPVSGSLKSEEALSALLGDLGITSDHRVVFYDDRGGFHAARMLWLLEYLGHRNVAVLNGGLTAWIDAGGPTTTEEIDHETTRFDAAVSPRRYASAEDVLAGRENSLGVLIDVRPPSFYKEGHIPWATNIPWSRNLGENGRFLEPSALRAHFEENGVTPDKHVIMHCQVGLASSHSYVALRLLGYPSIQVYHRSWAEWGADPSLPRS
ncbi:MAG: sulfurtransferase [Planctomycetota bacterium]